MKDKNWNELIAGQLSGELTDAEKNRLCELLETNSELREELVEQSQFDAILMQVLNAEPTNHPLPHGDSSFEHRGEPNTTDAPQKDSSQSPNRTQKQVRSINGISENGDARNYSSAIWIAIASIAAMALIAISIQLAYQTKANSANDSPPIIAKITGSSGPLQWIGDEGIVESGLKTGAKLTGGTIDGLSPDSWFELEFNDKSKVVISGNSVLTFSDHGQKKLYLKGGTFSANVQPQPTGRPMLIYTRSAMLEVLGTQFDVQTDLSSTFLNVNEGKVRVQRLSDGNSIDVPANHRVVAAADRNLTLQKMPASVSNWASQIQSRPDRTYGDWIPQIGHNPAKLKAIPYTTELGKTLYATNVTISSADNPPVILSKNTILRIQGNVEKSCQLYLGVTLRTRDGSFAGRFQATRAVDDGHVTNGFEFEIDLKEFILDPALENSNSNLAIQPFEHIVSDVWCHSNYDQAGLSISQAELIGPN